MKNFYIKLVILLGSIGITAFAFTQVEAIVAPSVTARIRTQDTGYFQNYAFFLATTTNATSTNGATSNDPGYFVVTGAKKLTMYFSRGDTSGQGNTGSSKFTVQVSPDGTNWYNWNKLTQNVATSTNEWLVGSDTVPAGTSTDVLGVDLRSNSFYSIRCIVVETTDGEHTCKATAEY